MSEFKTSGMLTSNEVRNIARTIPNQLLRTKFNDQMSLQLQNHDRESPRGTVSVRQAEQVLENLVEHVGTHSIRQDHLKDLQDAINNRL